MWYVLVTAPASPDTPRNVMRRMQSACCFQGICGYKSGKQLVQEATLPVPPPHSELVISEQWTQPSSSSLGSLGLGQNLTTRISRASWMGELRLMTKPLPAIQEMYNWLIYLVPKPNRPFSVGFGALLWHQSLIITRNGSTTSWANDFPHLLPLFFPLYLL